jgi:hypothetical protein
MPLMAAAQTQSFEFYYIAHDRTTPVSELCSRLESVYETALSYEDYAVVFYFPNYDVPIIVKVNLPGDNRDDFKNIISELRVKPSHETFPDIDYRNIIDIINRHDFIDADGKPTYTSCLFCWYVNPDFWRFNYNEALLASVYFTCDFGEYPGYVETQVWHAANDGLKVNSQLPFGTKNLCANMHFMLQQY